MPTFQTENAHQRTDKPVGPSAPSLARFRVLLEALTIWALMALSTVIEDAYPRIGPPYALATAVLGVGYCFHRAWRVIPVERSIVRVCLQAFTAYCATVFFFAEIYSLISSVDGNAFNKQGRPFDFIYFSIVTMATVGYGDIVPQSTLAKLFVSLQILVGTAFNVLIFGLVAAHVSGRFASHRDR